MTIKPIASARPLSAAGAAALWLGASALTPVAAEPLVLSVGGGFTQSFQLIDADSAPGGNAAELEDEVLAQNAEVHFKGKGRLDNGTEIGFRIELEAQTTSDQIDEHYVYAQGDWGKLILGAENGVGHLMQVRAPAFVPGLRMYDNSLTDGVFEEGFDLLLADDAIEDAHMSTKLEHISGDANKLSYMTPRVGGLQLGVSYTPNNEDRSGGEHNAVNTADASQDEILEIGVTLHGTANGVRYRLGYSSVEADNTDAARPMQPESSSFGLALGFGDWEFGGNLSEYKNLGEVNDAYRNSDTIETSNVGLKYKLSRSTHIGLGFTDGEETHRAVNYVSGLGADAMRGGSGNDADTMASVKPVTAYEEVMIGGGTRLGSGISLGYYYTLSEASHQRVEVSSDAADTVIQSDGEISAVGVTLAMRF